MAKRTKVRGRNTGYATKEYQKFLQESKIAPVGCVKSHFLDSGSFSLWGLARKWAKETGKPEWDYYDTEDFWCYMRRYVAFVKKYPDAIDYYANVDVIPNPQLSYRNQKWLEKRGLNPVPIVHLKDSNSLKWFKRYIAEGYDFIGLGGMAAESTSEQRRNWLDACFNIACDTPSRCPCVKLHGFGIVQHGLLTRYPWYSVDSAGWTKKAAYGFILVPLRKGGKWLFDKPPKVVAVAMEDRTRSGHYARMGPMHKQWIEDWIAFIGLPIGKAAQRKKKRTGIGEELDHAEVLEFGVTTRHWDRRIANLLYYDLLAKAQPEYPWPFQQVGHYQGEGLGFL